MSASGMNRMMNPDSRKRSVFEVGFWLLFTLVFWSLSTFAKIQEYQATNRRVDLLAIITNEVSSAVSALLMFFFVRWWLNTHPFNKDQLPSAFAWHGLGAVLFSAGHVLIFMLLRSITYWVIGLSYDHAVGVGISGLLRMFAYEFSQDLPLYIAMVLILSLYRQWLASRGAARNIRKYPEIILASLGTREKALHLNQVEWIRAAGNYVDIHCQGQEYLLRSTMVKLEKTLDPDKFQRVHRSYIVNVNAVDVVLPMGSGQQLLRTRSGAEIPLGRSFRNNLLERLSLPQNQA